MVHEGDQIQTMQGPPRVAIPCTLHLQSCSSETKNHETEIWFLHCGACRLQCSCIAASAVTLFFSESEIPLEHRGSRGMLGVGPTCLHPLPHLTYLASGYYKRLAKFSISHHAKLASLPAA
jgi:hypothetical protein